MGVSFPDDRKVDKRGPSCIVEDLLPRDLVSRLALVTGVEVAIPARKATTRDLDSQPMAVEEDVACRP